VRIRKIVACSALAVALTACSGEGNAVKRPNAPLDAIRYEAPAWAQGDALKVVDRSTGASWWVLRVDGQTVVLPITVRDMDMTQIGG